MGSFDEYGRFQNYAGTSEIGSGFDMPAHLPFAGSPTVQAGQTWHVQLWYRDGLFGASNFSDGLTVRF